MQRSCPSCGGFAVRRSRTQHDDDGGRRFFQARYRCRNCSSHFWAVSTRGFRLAIVAGVLATLCILAVGTFAIVTYFGEPVEGTSPETAQTQAAVGKAGLAGVDAERDSAARRLGARADDALSDADRMASLERAAEEGNVDAQYALGITLLGGQWGAEGNKHAAVWLGRAAERGHGLAQMQLARLYRAGVGVHADNVKAYVWLNLAAAQGVTGAEIARDAVAALLMPAEISKAHAELQRISERQHKLSVPIR
jgi:TPR repeat protein